MINFLIYIFPIILAIPIVVYIFILHGDLPVELSIIYTIISLICYGHICGANKNAKKIMMYNIRNFFTVVFINILFLPYISNLKVRYVLMTMIFFIGFILTLIILKLDKKLIKKKRELYKYIGYTLGLAIVFELCKLVIPYLHNSIIADVLWIGIVLYLVISIRKKNK